MSADTSLDSCKIFVGGLSWQTTEESLRYHFEQFGTVVSVEVMRDRVTGDPRGFAFVVFSEESIVDLVMSERRHEINHKVVDVKRAQARGLAPPSIHADKDGNPKASQSHEAKKRSMMTPEMLQNKIFVGGLPLDLDKDGLQRFFEEFGPVVDSIVMVDQNTKRSRGFGFVTFEDGTGAAQKALAAQPLYINSKYVELKLAQPKENISGAGKGLRNPELLKRTGSSSQSGGEFSGLATSYGRSGWKAGFGSYAFGKCGWNIEGWDEGKDPEHSGFSFQMISEQYSEPNRKRARLN
eukprot:CAMPEP_0116068486 /NCGR_PEP_ID=MMETSP0322-20121206/11687_1 /TAXON_ID=163516 /ORGANISM="Leptocylindrus danicus var. apora, Strain B651" /LENGTH=294 /DNA_ID=CAMNT_0003555601 /DNA_START=22 /DNA_END=909 /DNA_ORIENTATION=+